MHRDDYGAPRFCVCIVVNGASDRVEGTKDECMPMMMEMLKLTEKEAASLIFDSYFVGRLHSEGQYELDIERLDQ
ncbi:UNVERIFIED_ORG: hypothetical protein LHK14_00550 [Roseateles sp. XES5]|nr:hypothetical protein [Roseateles sp. XES5]